MLHFACSLNSLSSDITDRFNAKSECSTNIARSNERRDCRCSNRKLCKIIDRLAVGQRNAWDTPTPSSCLNEISHCLTYYTVHFFSYFCSRVSKMYILEMRNFCTKHCLGLMSLDDAKYPKCTLLMKRLGSRAGYGTKGKCH